jgi:hypothetical protein
LFCISNPSAKFEYHDHASLTDRTGQDNCDEIVGTGDLSTTIRKDKSYSATINAIS